MMKKLPLLLLICCSISCSDDDINSNPTELSAETTTIRVPLSFNESVFISSGRIDSSPTVEDMDLLGVAVMSSPIGQDNYSVYANGLFPKNDTISIPDSLEFTLSPNRNYRFFAVCFDNRYDSIIGPTFLSNGNWGNFENKLGKLNYGTDADYHYTDVSIRNLSARYFNKIDNRVKEVTDPLVDFYFAQFELENENDGGSFEFRRHNTRYVVSVQNVNEDSRIDLRLGSGLDVFEVLEIASDTSFTIDMAHQYLKGDGGELFNDYEVWLLVDHKYREGEINFSENLYRDNVSVRRLEIVTINIIAPNVSDAAGDGGRSGYTFINEEFFDGNEVVIGG